MGGHRRVEVGMSHGDLQGAITAHGRPRDAAILSPGARPVRALDMRHQLLNHEVLVSETAGVIVGIEATTSGGVHQDHLRNLLVEHESFHPGRHVPVLRIRPAGVIVEDAVKEVEHRVAAIAAAVGRWEEDGVLSFSAQRRAVELQELYARAARQDDGGAIDTLGATPVLLRDRRGTGENPDQAGAENPPAVTFKSLSHLRFHRGTPVLLAYHTRPCPPVGRWSILNDQAHDRTDLQVSSPSHRCTAGFRGWPSRCGYGAVGPSYSGSEQGTGGAWLPGGWRRGNH